MQKLIGKQRLKNQPARIARSFSAGGKRLLFLSVVFLVGTILSFISNASAQQDSSTVSLKFEAQRYYWGKEVRQNLPQAFTLYLEAARRGDTEAQYIVGGMYFKGIGTERNPKEAFKWLYKAAESGRSTPQSQKILGQDFLVGEVVPRNYSQSVQWYKLAAENGDHDAQNELAFLYYTGKGVEQDFQTSFKWFEKAAKGGLAIAQYNVGIMWYTGDGVDKQDLITAYSWLSLAAANGYGDANQASHYIETLLDPSELKEAQKKATSLYKQINVGQNETK
jgi:uncharacterized protein